MFLTKEESRTLKQFLFLYLSSSFILFAIIAYLFYQNEYRFFYDKITAQLEMDASRLSSKIIHAHMSDIEFSLDWVVNNYGDRIGFYDKKDEVIISNIKDSIDFSKQIYQDEDRMILVDRSSLGHLGVDSIVIERNGVVTFVKKLQQKIIFLLLFSYIVLSILGFFLAKLFIKPIQMKRIQLDNFIKDSTHELNTPITALILSVNSPMLHTKRSLERIRLSASRISEIHKDLTYLLLDIEEDRVEEKILLNEIIENELKYLTLLAEKRQITIRVEQKGEIYFNIDRESFIRLIHNLISNAIKYNKLGGKIDIWMGDSTLHIKDSGIGIDKKHNREIYKRFYRATDQVGGFGLGLNIVYKICKAYGIGIEYESIVGEGTIFKLKF